MTSYLLLVVSDLIVLRVCDVFDACYNRGAPLFFWRSSNLESEDLSQKLILGEK